MAGTPAEARFNRTTLGTYEPGSAFKTFTAAMALDYGTGALSTRWTWVERTWRASRCQPRRVARAWMASRMRGRIWAVREYGSWTIVRRMAASRPACGGRGRVPVARRSKDPAAAPMGTVTSESQEIKHPTL